MVGTLYKIYNAFSIGDLSANDKQSVNAGILDTIEYDGFQYSVPISSYLSDGDIVCENPKAIENFTYSFHHLYELWYIYGIGVFLALMVHIYIIYTNYTKKKKGKFVLQGVRSHRDR